jgi:hypothetical protein
MNGFKQEGICCGSILAVHETKSFELIAVGSSCDFELQPKGQSGHLAALAMRAMT